MMPFEKEFLTYLIDTNKNISVISAYNGVSLYNYDKKFNLHSSAKIISGTQTFIDSYFNIDSNNNIYGLINSKKGSLIYTYINEYSIIKTTLIKLTSRYKCIKCPYIRKINNTIHIFYYLVNTAKTNTCSLFHHFFNGHNWINSKISDINYFLLTNFVVLWNNNIPTIFFLKKVKNCSEVFVASYDTLTNTWLSPYAITNTKKEKVYLSVICKNDLYHITYAESNNNKYYCIYFNGAFSNNTFNKLSNYTHINRHAVCSFPTLISQNSNIFLQWVENNELLSRKYNDSNNTWSDIFNNPEVSDLSFYRCQKNLNSKDDCIFFGYKNSIVPII